MSNELLARIRKQREFKAKVGRFTFVCRRPTASEMYALLKNGAQDNDRIASDFVVGWEGVTENDVVGGGGSDGLAFDARLWREWCAERIDFWEPLANAIVDAFQEHKRKLDEDAKNSQPGSS